MITRNAAIILVLTASLAQPQSDSDTQKGSIKGTIWNAATEAPMAEVQVSVFGPKQLKVVTDAQGTYRLIDLPAGAYHLYVRKPDPNGPDGTRKLTLGPGENLSSIDFHLKPSASIAGRITDQNKEPVAGIMVLLITKAYSSGALRDVFASAATTDDDGNYVLSRVEPGRSYFVLADRGIMELDAISDAPADPKRRRPAFVPTYYPNSDAVEGAQALVLRPGERREGIDIRVQRGPSYCVEGELRAGVAPSALQFSIATTHPSSASFGNGTTYVASPGGITGDDGKVRICDLHPGEYELTVSNDAPIDKGPSFFATAQLVITDKDVTGITISARPRVPFSGVVSWEGPPPEQPVTTKVDIDLEPVNRASFGEKSDTSANLPGEFSLPDGVLLGDYSVQIGSLPANLYVKEITYGDHSMPHQLFAAGSAAGDAQVRVVVARDGGFINAKVIDKNESPVANAYVLIVPSSATSENDIAETMISGQSDQNGAYTSRAIPPGKYYVLAASERVDPTPENITRIQLLRSHAQEVEVGGGATMQVTVSTFLEN
jgi:hypothetical protein